MSKKYSESDINRSYSENDINKSSTGSLRFNSGKPEVSQLDPRFILALAKHLTDSSEKYGRYNYALGQEYHTPFDSLMRHAADFMSGNDFDEDGKCNIIAMAANVMILWTSKQLNNKELDTRFNWNRKKEFKTHNGLTEDDLEQMSEEYESYEKSTHKLSSNVNYDPYKLEKEYIKNLKESKEL